MQRRSKIIVIALVVCLAGGAAFVFRKRGPSSADVLQAEAPAAAQVEAPRRGPDKPAPQSHLLGEIQTSDQAAGDGELTPIAPSTGASVTTPGAMEPSAGQQLSVGHAPLRPAGPPPTENPPDAQPLAPIAAASAPPASSRTELVRHRIVDGDTLTALAERYLGSANRFLEIFDLNRDTLADPDLLPIGAELKIPARGLIAQPPAPQDPQPMVPLAPVGQANESADLRNSRTYRVRRHDTLTGIAAQVYGDPNRYAELLDANRQKISRPESLRAGTVLVIP